METDSMRQSIHRRCGRQTIVIPSHQLLSWNAADSTLTAEFPDSVAPEGGNAALVPALLGFDLVSVAVGRTLEEAYLGRL